MKVNVLAKTPEPERLACQCARGDYSEEYIGDTEYSELMKNVDVDRGSAVWAYENIAGVDVGDDEDPVEWLEDERIDAEVVLEAKTRAFIRRQLSRGHFGICEHPSITFAMKGISRVTMAQITRHRLLSFDVQSMRYANFEKTKPVVPVTLLTPEERMEKYPHVFDTPAKAQNENMTGGKGKQIDMTDEDSANARKLYEKGVKNAMKMYKSQVAMGVPEEDARFVLPLGTPVNMSCSGNARSFLHLMDMRKKPNAQWEIQELAGRMFDELKEFVPHMATWYDERPHKLAP